MGSTLEQKVGITQTNVQNIYDKIVEVLCHSIEKFNYEKLTESIDNKLTAETKQLIKHKFGPFPEF